MGRQAEVTGNKKKVLDLAAAQAQEAGFPDGW
jgi:hypothetical protein